MLNSTLPETPPRFSLGALVITPRAEMLLPEGDVARILSRHQQGDWGDACQEDAKENELAIKEGFRIMSVYTVLRQKFWVITEADRSVTTILLPDDY